MADYQFANRYLNKSSGVTDDFGCTFNLASSLDENGHIVYNEWLIAPKLFNDGNANGKKTYSGSSLTFNRVGNTYTLTSATAAGVGSIGTLEKFFNPSPKAGTIYDENYTNSEGQKNIIFTNNFWPLDGAQDKKDPIFGETDKAVPYRGYVSGGNGNWTNTYSYFPGSDDGRAHNSFFGMQYAVEFTLTPDYVGPLEYTFFGDDDMWVFLDQQLVCDIGGVHSSVGEYVNLWDYINKIDGEERTETKTHTLTIFYTERGASGSTCYMNFTLPSVSGVTLKQTTGNLSVGKEVVGESDQTKDFTFRATFDPSSAFAYYRFDANGIRIDTDKDLTLSSGQTFTLKAGEHIEFQNLPIGMQYSLEETDYSGYSVTNTVNGVVGAGANATGVLIKDMLNEVIFTNTRGTVPLTLQKLDQDGQPLKDAVFELRNAAAGPVYAMKNTDSTSGQILYTVPSSGANQIQSGALYYIALAESPSFVIGQDASAEKHNATLQQKADNGLQKFRVYRQADGSYSFYCEQSQLWLDLDGRGLTNGTLVHFWSNADRPTTEDAQKWYLIANGDGTFKIKPRSAVLNQSTAVLDLNAGIASVGQKIQTWEDNASPAQKWLLVPVEEAETTKELAVDEGGVLRLAGLLPGSYTLTETQAPGGYQKLSQSITFRVGADGTITLADGTITDAIVANDGILQVRNRHEDLTLTLKKELVNSQSTQTFPFTVSYVIDGQMVTKTLGLAGGKSGALTIPYGAKVTITETEHDGFAVTFKNAETVLAQGDTCTIERMTADAAITAVNAAGYALPGTGGGALWLQLAGAALVLLTLPAYNWIKTKKQKAKGRTRP